MVLAVCLAQLPLDQSFVISIPSTRDVLNISMVQELSKDVPGVQIKLYPWAWRGLGSKFWITRLSLKYFPYLNNANFDKLSLKLTFYYRHSQLFRLKYNKVA